MWSKLERATVGSYFAALRNTAKPTSTTSGRAGAVAWVFCGVAPQSPKILILFCKKQYQFSLKAQVVSRANGKIQLLKKTDSID